MSSITILQERDKFTYFVDTAQSMIINDTIYRVRGMNAQKTYPIAKDIVFMSGDTRDSSFVRSALPDMVDANGHINIDELQVFLKKNLHPIDDLDSKKIFGLVILSIVNGKTLMVAMKQSFEHFKIISSGPPVSGIDIHTDGFDNVKIGDAILERNKRNIEATGKSFIDMDIFDTYKDLYSEGVGGEIHMYLFDALGPRLLRIEKLEETGLRYLDKGANILPSGEYITVHINGHTPITSGNVEQQSVLSAYRLVPQSWTSAAYLSINNNFIPNSSGMNIGSSQNPWAGGYGVSGWTTTSDERLKEDVSNLDERYLQLAKLLVPKLFKMKQGTSGRSHTGFIAQEVEAAMVECGISDMEFAGLVKAPVYAEKLKDKDGNELNEYDTTSEIIDYTYHLRYEEFIPLLFLWLGSLDNEAAAPPESL